MKHPMWFVAMLALAALILFAWGLAPPTDANKPAKYSIALIMDTDIGLNSAVIREGARMAAQIFGAELDTVALPDSQRPETQTELLLQQLDAGAAAVMMVPACEAAAEAAVRLCAARDIPLVLLDACQGQRGSAPYVGTDHKASGSLACESILEISGAKNLMILYGEGQIYSERLKGALLAAQRMGAKASSFAVARPDARVRTLIAQHPDADAVLCLDGALTECAAEAIESLGAERSVALAGFDCDQTRIACLEAGPVRFTMLRNPLEIGYKGLQCAMELAGERIVAPVQYVDAALVMREDALNPEYAQLVFPLIH